MDPQEHRRRLAAIISADAAAYSRLMAADESATVQALDAARVVFGRQAEAKHGRIVDTAGDSVLAVFETAAGAVSAALAIQKQIDALASTRPEDCRLRFRIGVHLGDVVEKADGTIYGNGVNIAARLQMLGEPGGVIVSDAVRGTVRGKVAALFDDKGEQMVKNIAEPVRAFAVRDEGSGPAPLQTHPGANTIDLSLPDKPSIAVLPFVNLSGDPEQEYFTDGLTEDIITELSRFHSLFVIARNSSFTYRGQSRDIRRVGKELGVRYILEGSVRKSAQHIRVTAQLVDAITGHHIWAEKYDRVLDDILELQEELTRAIVMAIAPQVEASELAKVQRPRPTTNLSAYEISLNAMAAVRTGYQKADAGTRGRALELARQALAIDPRCVGALDVLAWLALLDMVFGTAVDPKAAYEQCAQASERSLEVDPTGHLPHAFRGIFEIHSRTPQLRSVGLNRLRRAYALNPNDVLCVLALAFGEACGGDHVKARELAMDALRANPRDSHGWMLADTLAFAHFLAREYATGLDWALHALSQVPGAPGTHEHAILNYVGLGRIDEARRQVEEMRKTTPAHTALLLEKGWLHLADDEQRRRTRIFFRVAAGQEDASAADALWQR